MALRGGRSRSAVHHRADAAVERHGLEGIVSKRRDSRYRAGRCDAWLKVKCFAEDTFDVIGIERTRAGEVNALLAKPAGGGQLDYAGRAFVTLPREDQFDCGKSSGFSRT